MLEGPLSLCVFLSLSSMHRVMLRWRKRIMGGSFSDPRATCSLMTKTTFRLCDCMIVLRLYDR